MTLKHIADAVGVSTMTASRCLRGSGRVDPETRQLIQNAAKRLGYFKYQAALTPKTRRMTDRGLRVLLPILPFDHHGVESPHGQAILRGLRSRLEEGGGRLLLENASSLADLLAICKSQRLHAVVLRHQMPDKWIARISSRYPVIYAVAQDSQCGVDCIYTNEHRSAATILRHLNACGHERIVWFGTMDRHTPLERVEGFDSIVHTHGVRYAAWAHIALCSADSARHTFMILDHDWRTQSLRDVLHQACDKICALSPRPTAVVMPADILARELIRVLESRGLRVPADIGVVGYGGFENYEPKMTTVRLPMELLGRTIPELIERRLADPSSPPMSIQLEATLQTGETVRSLVKPTE